MFRLTRCLGLLLALVVALPGQGADDTKKDTKKEKYFPAGEMSGKFVKIESNHVTIHITQNVPVKSGKTITTRPTNKDMGFDTIDEVQVRLADVPFTIDDKGNRRKMNAKELQPLKVPGTTQYRGDTSDLKKDQIVILQLGKKKPADPAEKAKVTTIIIKGEVVK